MDLETNMQEKLEKSFSQQVEQFFLTEDQNDFGNKIPFLEDKNVELDSEVHELVSKELNHLVAILQHYAGGLIFMK